MYFQNTKRMTEFSKKRGFDGKGKFCGLCSRECTYIATYEQPSAQAVDPGLQAIDQKSPFGAKDMWRKLGV